MGSLADLSYDAGVRALDLQERAVEQLRSRTGTLLAAASLTASFLGGQTISHTRHLGKLEVLALVALALSVALCVYVLMPKEGFTFSLNAAGVYEELFPVADDDQEVKRRLVYWLEDYWRDNQRKIDRLSRSYLWAALALLAQLILWSVALAANIS
jgi:hypothetical protein